MSKFETFHELLNSPAFKVMHQIENSPHMKILGQISNDPMLKMLDGIHDSPYMKIMNQINNDSMVNMMGSISDSSILGTTNDFDNLLNGSIFQDSEGPLGNALKELIYFSENSAFNSAFLLAEKLSTFDTSSIYGKAYADIIRSFDDQDWVSVIDDYQLQINESPNNNLSLEFYLGLLITILILFYTQYSGIESEKRLVNKIDNLESMVVDLTDSLKGLESGAFFLVKVPLNLRVAPSVTSEIIETLPVKLKLSGIQTEGEWMQVEYFDYFSNMMVQGWVNSNYIQPVLVNNDE